MKPSVFVIVFACATLLLALVFTAFWIGLPKPNTALTEDAFNRSSDNVVGNETPFKPEW